MPPDDVRVFCQGTMPALDHNGKILLAEKGEISLAPDGHGGMLAALADSGCLDHAEERGVEHLFYGQIDNPLIQICDPKLIGYHLLSHSEMTTQVVEKAGPVEKVGNVVSIDGQVQIIEYSDLPDDVAERRDDDGSLDARTGSRPDGYHCRRRGQRTHPGGQERWHGLGLGRQLVRPVGQRDDNGPLDTSPGFGLDGRQRSVCARVAKSGTQERRHGLGVGI